MQTSQFNKWYYSIFCGLTGALGALFAKLGLQPKNFIYDYLLYIPYGQILEWILRVIFLLLCCWTNLKMVEYKIRSFAAIGSSLTVVVSFFSNYIASLLFEGIFFDKVPNFYVYQGSFLVLVGIVILIKGAKRLNRDSFYTHIEIESNQIKEDFGETSEEKPVTTVEYRRIENQRLLNMNSQRSNSIDRNFEQNNSNKK